VKERKAPFDIKLARVKHTSNLFPKKIHKKKQIKRRISEQGTSMHAPGHILLMHCLPAQLKQFFLEKKSESY
jgi:hypothetical protein